jgi:thiamine kinase-like enzyme
LFYLPTGRMAVRTFQSKSKIKPWNMLRSDSIASLTDPEFLSRILGPIAKVEKTMLPFVGYSGSVLERVEIILQTGVRRNFILKSTQIKADWLSQRSKDQVGREAALLGESSLSGIWDHIHCPYVAFAKENGIIGLLMDDFSNYLFPDIREPIDSKSEDLILNSIASLHASFWESKELNKIDWLVNPYNYLEVFAAGEHESDQYAPPPPKIGHSIREGWNIALRLLPAEIIKIITRPAKELFETWNDLPITLLHGDAKIANMVILPSGNLVMFDWTYVGRGPCGMELGWYIAVNSTRLTRSKEDIIRKYRSCLEFHLNFAISEEIWAKIIDLAIVTGSRMMLWNKALSFQEGTQRGKEEWTWWENRLKGVAFSKTK